MYVVPGGPRSALDSCAALHCRRANAQREGGFTLKRERAATFTLALRFGAQVWVGRSR